jgi:hypothetical protein
MDEWKRKASVYQTIAPEPHGELKSPFAVFNAVESINWGGMLIEYRRSRYNRAVPFLARCRWTARTLVDAGGKSDAQSGPSNGMA